jgi:hypothetical protein
VMRDSPATSVLQLRWKSKTQRKDHIDQCYLWAAGRTLP